MRDHFPEATVRHYLDGVLLHQEGRYDNAMCHYAFSAECAIKAFRTQFLQVYKERTSIIKPDSKFHKADSALISMTEYHEFLGALDPHFSLLIGTEAPPSILFQEHPDRRYKNDISYTDAELSECKAFANRFVQRVIDAVIDGRLEYESVRGAL